MTEANRVYGRHEQERRFVALYERHYEDVLAYAQRRVGFDRARDVAADTFLVAWRRWEQMPEHSLPWLYGVARKVLANEARTELRRERLRRRVFTSTPSAGGAAQPDHSDGVTAGLALSDAMASLSSRDRELLRLIAWEGLDIRAAAQAMGCSSATMTVRLHRARRRLSRLLESPSFERAQRDEGPNSQHNSNSVEVSQ